MLDSEMQRAVEDLKRATTLCYGPGEAEKALERVVDDVDKIRQRIEQSQRGRLYKSIYSTARR